MRLLSLKKTSEGLNNMDRVNLIIKKCLEELPLEKGPFVKGLYLSPEYFYHHLVLCVIDAVYSIGAKYASTRQVPIRYCKHFQIERIWNDANRFPKSHQQEQLSTFVERVDQQGYEYFMEEIFCNRQKTSTRNGIRKAEAVYLFAKVLVEHGVETFQDFEKADKYSLKLKIQQIPGQKSGISFDYFKMLAGDDQMVKADRMIHRFLTRHLNESFNTNEAIKLIQQSAMGLTMLGYDISPRELDHLIWKLESE